MSVSRFFNTQSCVAYGKNGSDNSNATATSCVLESSFRSKCNIVTVPRYSFSSHRLEWIPVPFGTRYVVQDHCRRHNGNGFEKERAPNATLQFDTNICVISDTIAWRFYITQSPPCDSSFPRYRRSQRHLLHRLITCHTREHSRLK